MDNNIISIKFFVPEDPSAETYQESTGTTKEQLLDILRKINTTETKNKSMIEAVLKILPTLTPEEVTAVVSLAIGNVIDIGVMSGEL